VTTSTLPPYSSPVLVPPFFCLFDRKVATSNHF
jgi:hypothetical protein